MTPRLARAVLAAAVAALVTVLPDVAVAELTTQPPTWNFAQTHVSAAQQMGLDGRGVTVAVVDTWVDSSHPDFEGRVLPGADCTGGSCHPGPATADRCTHGTHVAGIVGSARYGVAPAASILPVRVLTDGGKDGSDCTGSTTDVALGIRWAAAHGARIINLSLASDQPAVASAGPVVDAVRDVVQSGAIVVVAAGNDSGPIDDAYDGDAIIVAATGPSGQLASYSQRGPAVTLAAPGGDVSGDACTPAGCIASTWPGNRYALLEGTSMAAPHVAGIAALLLAQNPGLTEGEVAWLLTSTAHPIPGGAGAGLVDAQAALKEGAAYLAARLPQPAGTPVAQPGARPAAVPGAASVPAPRPKQAGPAAPVPQPATAKPVPIDVSDGAPKGVPTAPIVAAGALAALVLGSLAGIAQSLPRRR